MAASLPSFPIAHNVAVTNINVSETTFTWAVNNFSFSPRAPGSRLYSPVFSTTNYKNIVWRLDFYPNGQNSSNSMFLYLRLMRCSKFKIDIMYEFSIVNKSGSLENTVKSQYVTFSEGTTDGFEFLLSRDYLTKNSDKLVPNDTLTIFCKIKARLGFQNAVAKMAIVTAPGLSNYSPASSTNFLQAPTVTTANTAAASSTTTVTTTNLSTLQTQSEKLNSNLPEDTVSNAIVPFAIAPILPPIVQTIATPYSNGLQLPISTAYNLLAPNLISPYPSTSSQVINPFAYAYAPSTIFLERSQVYARGNYYKRKRCYLDYDSDSDSDYSSAF